MEQPAAPSGEETAARTVVYARPIANNELSKRLCGMSGIRSVVSLELSRQSRIGKPAEAFAFKGSLFRRAARPIHAERSLSLKQKRSQEERVSLNGRTRSKESLPGGVVPFG